MVLGSFVVQGVKRVGVEWWLTDAVRDIFYHAFRGLGVAVQREPKGLYQGSSSLPADVLVPPALESCSDKGALIASALAEKSKLEDHENMVLKYGVSYVVVDFQKFGIAFESSGALGRHALSLWSGLKYAAAEVGFDNDIVSRKPHT